MKKKIIILSTVLIVLGAIIVLGILGFKAYDSIRYSDFYDIANAEFYIPDLMDGFVPQGFDYLEKEHAFIACGYMSNGEASRIYVIDKDGDSYYYTELRQTDINVAYTGHTGGIAYYGDYVYVTGSDGVDVFDLSVILDKNVKQAPKLATVDTSKYGVDPAYCFVYEDELFVGAFHKDGDYNTPTEHHLGDNRALMLSFPLSARFKDTNYYVNPTPSAMFSMPSYVQGVAIAEHSGIEDGKAVTKTSMILSTSWGFNPSNLYVHDLTGENGVLSKVNSDFSKQYGVTAPLYTVGADSLVDTIEAPPMSEEIVYLDGKIWIFNESACNKYIFGKFTTGNYLYSVEYPLTLKD